MNFWLIVIAVCFSILSTAASANANCADAERSRVTMRAASNALNAETAAARAKAQEVSATPATFVRFLAATIASWERHKKAIDRTIVLMKRAMAKGCPSGGAPFSQLIAEYEDLSRLYGNDLRVFRKTYADVRRAIRERKT